MRLLLGIRDGFFRRMISSRKNRLVGKPTTVHISITNRCNLSCLMCDLWKKNDEKELSIDDWKRIIDNLEQWLGPFTLKIAGGEPLRREGIAELITYANSKGIFTGLSTNGTLIDDAMARALVKAGLDEIHLSIDSLDSSIHDMMRRKKGALQKAQEAISHLKRHKEIEGSKMTINLAAVINKRTVGSVRELVGYVEQNQLHSINFQALYQNFGAEHNPRWYLASSLWPDDLSKVDDAMDFLIAKRGSSLAVGNGVAQLEAMKRYFHNPGLHSDIRCRAGTKDIAFDPQGNFLLCFNKPSVGMMLKESPDAIWDGKRARRRRDEISSCNMDCKLLNCNFEE
jgi:MoaA/NifB/PqqE/SkfB family radical SAM enzyme